MATVCWHDRSDDQALLSLARGGRRTRGRGAARRGLWRRFDGRGADDGDGRDDDSSRARDDDGAATTTTAPEPTTTPDGAKTITIVVKNAAPQGGIKRATVKKGDSVNLVIHSDVEDEVHLHGYNFSADVAAGGVATIHFVANVPGRFEAELEQRGVKIADLTVTP